MSLRKPILKVTKECPKCKGSGQKTIKTKRTDSYFEADGILGKYVYIIIDCPRCKGIGRVDIKQTNPRFKKYYKKDLEERIDDLTTEYRNAKEEAYKIGEELAKHCKELDKVMNK